jgi:hypothetical protein
MECFISSFDELGNSRCWWFSPRYWFSKKPRPLIIFDDVQKLFKSEKIKDLQSLILNSMLYPIRDSNQACIMLITSDYSIEDELSSLSGMRTRLKTSPFPKLTKEDFRLYVKENFEILQNLNKLLTVEILMKHFEDFNTDLRNLNSFIEKFKGDYESKFLFNY